ncbi:MAG: CBS domain-containing protein [Alphaproteobacteria bacterium]|nr:CBS domain-containing protein [Alphaproteobacteria bacterium]
MLPTDRKIVPDVIKSPQDLATVTPDISVAEVSALMTKRHIGAILVLEKGRLAGIFTERDALTRVLAKGIDPVKTEVGKVMTANPDTIQPTESVQTALDLMAERGYRHLPVIEDGKLYGIISIRDLYRSVKQQMEEDILLLAEMLIQS